MKDSRTRFLAFLVLCIGLAGCSSGYKSTPATVADRISISSTGAMAGSPDLTLTIAADNGLFYNNAHTRSLAVWRVNGSLNPLSTTLVNSSIITAVIPAALLSNPVKAQVTVETTDRNASLSSNPIFFNVTPGPPGHQISISPTNAPGGGPKITLTITTSHEEFDNAPHNLSRVVWSTEGVDFNLTTTFVSNSLLTAVVPARLLGGTAEAEVFVETGDPAGSDPPVRSSSATFEVFDPAWGY